MPGMNEAVGGVNEAMRFFANYLAGERQRTQQMQQTQFGETMQQGIQSGQLQPSYSAGPNGITQSASPIKTVEPRQRTETEVINLMTKIEGLEMALEGTPGGMFGIGAEKGLEGEQRKRVEDNVKILKQRLEKITGEKQGSGKSGKINFKKQTTPDKSGGTIMVDAQGNKAMVYPDGSYKEIK